MLNLIDTVNIPDYALCTLINDDSSGIDQEDLDNINEWEQSYSDYLPLTYNILEGESSFCSSPEFGLPCNCSEVEIYSNKGE